MDEMHCRVAKGRFAPSPSGRMHLGNMFTALISWLSVRSLGGQWVLRIEDLDPQRSRFEYARLIEEDLQWLGLDWDEGDTEGTGPSAPYCQSGRHDIYQRMLDRITATGMTYPCYCTRADIMATQAPHESDGRVIYRGTCRPASMPCRWQADGDRRYATRLCVPDRDMTFTDGVFGRRTVNLAEHCGDFVLRRADGAWAYQLAVVADDALMGISEVIRGCDLLLSTAQQLYLYELLGCNAPAYAHLPLICNEDGRRLSKRDRSMSMEELRRRYSPAGLTGLLAWLANIIPTAEPCTAADLIPLFNLEAIPQVPSLAVPADV